MTIQHLSPLVKGGDYSPQHTKDPDVDTDFRKAPLRAIAEWDGRVLYHMGSLQHVGGIYSDLALLVLSFKLIGKPLSGRVIALSALGAGVLSLVKVALAAGYEGELDDISWNLLVERNLKNSG